MWHLGGKKIKSVILPNICKEPFLTRGKALQKLWATKFTSFALYLRLEDLVSALIFRFAFAPKALIQNCVYFVKSIWLHLLLLTFCFLFWSLVPVFVCASIHKYNLFSLHSGTCLYIFRADLLVLDIQLVCSLLGKIISPVLSIQ